MIDYPGGDRDDVLRSLYANLKRIEASKTAVLELIRRHETSVSPEPASLPMTR